MRCSWRPRHRLEEIVRAGDLVARLGGDEFVVVMRDLGDPTEAVRAADRLVLQFRAPFAIGGRELFATASVGVAIATEEAEAGDLLREADTAMYAAKATGRDRVSMFNEDLRTAVSRRMAVEADLRHALERGQLAVWYQPEVDLTTGAVIALEALLRWHHPDGDGVDRGPVRRRRRGHRPDPRHRGLGASAGLRRRCGLVSGPPRPASDRARQRLRPPARPRPACSTRSTTPSPPARWTHDASASRSPRPRCCAERRPRRRTSRPSTTAASRSPSTTSAPATPP